MNAVIVFFRRLLSRRIGIVLGVLAGLYLLYGLLGAFVLPGFIKNIIEEKAGAALESQVRIAEIRINPYALSTTVSGLTVTKPGKQPWIAWDTLYVNVSLASVFTLSVSLDELRIIAPRVHWELEPASASATPAKPTDTRALTENFASRNQLPLSIRHFVMRDGAVVFRDLRAEKPKQLSLSPISFSLEQFSTRFKMGKNNQYDLQFAGPKGGLFRWSGNLQWTPFLSAGEMEIRGLDLTQFRDFYEDVAPVRLLEGELGFRTRYRVFEKPAIGLELIGAQLGLTGVRVTQSDTAYPLARLGSLQVGPMRISTLERTLRIEGIQVDSLQLRHVLKPAVPDSLPAYLNLDFLRYDSTAMDSVRPDMDPLALFLAKLGNRARWQLLVQKVAVRHAAVDIVDSLVVPGATHLVDSVQFTMDHVSNLALDSLPFELVARLNQSGKLSTNGVGLLFPVQLRARVDITQFPLPSLQKYATPYSTVLVRQGVFGAQLLAWVRPAADSSQKDSVRVSGALSVQNLRLDGPDAKMVASLGQLNATGLDATLPAQQLKIAQVVVQTPTAQVVRYADETINLTKLLKETPPIDASRKPGKPLGISIGSIKINQASASITDLTLPSPFLTRVSGFGGIVRNLSNQGKINSTFDLQGKMDGYAPFSLVGFANFTGAYPQIDLTLRSRSQELTPFSPYSGRFAGYKISKGQVETDLQYKIQNNQVQGKNRIVIRQFTFGDEVASDEAVSLPVRLGVALLSDKNGVIDLDVGIEGKLDDPEFSVGGMIWKVVKNLLGKAVAAPMRSLMALMGSEEDLQSIAFAPGTSELDGVGTGQLQKLAGALAQRPMLEMEVQGSAQMASDGVVLQEIQLTQQIAAASHLDPRRISATSVLEKPLRDSLFGYYQRALQKPWLPLLRQTTGADSVRMAQPSEADLRATARLAWNELLTAQTVPPVEMQKLAFARAQNVKAELIRLDSALGARIFVLESNDSTQASGAAFLKLKAD
jgi:hypothetical protein